MPKKGDDLKAALVSSAKEHLFTDQATIQGQPVSGIFDRQYVETLDYAGHAPIFTCASADLLGVSRGAQVLVDGVTYHVTGIQPDGTGVTVLILSE